VSRDLQAAIEDKGYLCIAAIGLGTRPDGAASVKIAANPGIRNLRGTREWQVIRQTIMDSLDRLMESPLDDLEIQR
jgi:hypothetical protein